MTTAAVLNGRQGDVHSNNSQVALVRQLHQRHRDPRGNLVLLQDDLCENQIPSFVNSRGVFTAVLKTTLAQRCLRGA